ncbi:MAG: M42 family metallopeptidase [Armatimonadetes bacterium]|nr:M42 family metallopeptidase [Armatimonadota bacterium]
MRAESLQFLKDLIAAPSPSGFEQPAQRVVRERMKQYADEISTDVHGNVMVVKNPDHPLRVMLAGHCDQVGMMVQHITDDGYLHFAAIGGVDPVIVIGTRVIIHSAGGPVLGVIGRKPIHLLDAQERSNPKLSLDKLFIDIGAKDRKAAEKLVALADPITYAADFQQLDGDLVVAPGFDDKMGTFVCMEALRILSRRKLDCGLYAVSTVQEELGLRGARTACFGIDPAVGIAVDVTHASDYPGCDKARQGDIKIGAGPTIAIGPNINPVVGKMLVETAREKKIPHQIDPAPRGTGTDANVIQISRAGVAAGLVSVPNRYMHTPVEVISLGDLENAAKLLAETVARINPDVDFTPM